MSSHARARARAYALERKTYLQELLLERRNAISDSDANKKHKYSLPSLVFDDKASDLSALTPRKLTSREKELLMNTDLSTEQIAAFREVFNLFDSNGGGTIDATELDETLKSVGILLGPDEIAEVVNKIDKDGNGEIDFSEFLELMTNTEKFLESMAGEESADSKQQSKARPTLLFEALHQFMKKSALNSIREIVGYYSTKYRKVQTPHVIGHYADGARLIGLTEKQLVQHLGLLRACNAGQNHMSPYAQPVFNYNMWFQKQPSRKNKSKKADPLIDSTKNTGKIRLKVTVAKDPEDPKKHSTYSLANVTSNQSRPSPPATKDRLLPAMKNSGWMSQRTKNAMVKLPFNQLKELGSFDSLTAEDLPIIREKVDAAKREYVAKRNECRKVDMMAHWKTLNPEAISSPVLRDNYKRLFLDYNLSFKDDILPVINKHTQMV